MKKARRKRALFCDLDWIRTNDPQLRRLMLYPTELPDQSEFWAANISLYTEKMRLILYQQ